MLPIKAEVRPADQHMVVYRCRPADYLQRFGHHAIDIRAAGAVLRKIVKGTVQIKNAYFYTKLWRSTAT
jgi:hypothetical protein